MKGLFYRVRTQVFVVVFGLAAIAFAGHFAILQPLLYEILLDHELDQVSATAQATAQTLDSEIGLAIHSLESLAALDGFSQLDQPRIEKALAIFDATNPFYIYTWALDKTGKVIAVPSRPDRLGEDRSHRDYLIEPTPENPTHFQKVQISTRGNFSLVVGTVIVDDGGEKAGVVAGSLGLMDRNPKIYQSVLSAPFPDEYTIILYSSNKILLAHSDKQLPQPSEENLEMLHSQPFMEYFDGKNKETRLVRHNGRKFYISYASVPAAEWTVAVQVPGSIVAQSISNITTGLTILLGVFLLFILAMSLFYAELLSSSLGRLTLALLRFGEQGKADQVPVKGVSGEIRDALHAFNKMVVDRKSVESRLKDSETRFRTLVEQAADAFFLHDENGKLLDVNQQACDSLGYSREELLALTVQDIDERAEELDHQGKIWDRIQPDAPITVEGIHRRKDGTTFPVEVRIGLLSFHNERYILALVRDISARKKTEAELRQAQKMEAIGNLAGGVAHDFNNILTAIFGNLELARMEMDDPDQIHERLESINQSAIRAKNLVQQILTFSRKTEQAKRPIRVEVVVREVMKLLRSSIPTTIDIVETIHSQSAVMGDPTQLHQIIMNLCTNGYHAMRETGGTLGVALKDVEITADDVALGLQLDPGSYVQLEVSDTGRGMTEEVKAKIFEPYFTTKSTGGGTGLGLAVVYGIVKNYEGCINVYSEPGQGTTFQVYLPVSDEDVGQENAEPEHVLTGNEHLMYVDDELSNVRVAREILRKYGYTVDVFTNGVQAWQEFQKEPDKYALVITDMTMPFMTGAELAQKILEISPNKPVILCTGYSEMINREKSMAMGISEYIQKPMTMSNLLRTVRRTLDERKPGRQ